MIRSAVIHKIFIELNTFYEKIIKKYQFDPRFDAIDIIIRRLVSDTAIYLFSSKSDDDDQFIPKFTAFVQTHLQEIKELSSYALDNSNLSRDFMTLLLTIRNMLELSSYTPFDTYSFSVDEYTDELRKIKQVAREMGESNAERYLEQSATFLLHAEKLTAPANHGGDYRKEKGISYHLEFFKRAEFSTAANVAKGVYNESIATYIQFYYIAVKKNEVRDFFAQHVGSKGCYNGNQNPVADWCIARGYLESLSERLHEAPKTSPWINILTDFAKTLTDSDDTQTITEFPTSRKNALFNQFSIEFELPLAAFNEDRLSYDNFVQEIMHSIPQEIQGNKHKIIVRCLENLITELKINPSSDVPLPKPVQNTNAVAPIEDILTLYQLTDPREILLKNQEGQTFLHLLMLNTNYQESKIVELLETTFDPIAQNNIDLLQQWFRIKDRNDHNSLAQAAKLNSAAIMRCLLKYFALCMTESMRSENSEFFFQDVFQSDSAVHAPGNIAFNNQEKHALLPLLEAGGMQFLEVPDAERLHRLFPAYLYKNMPLAWNIRNTLEVISNSQYPAIYWAGLYAEWLKTAKLSYFENEKVQTLISTLQSEQPFILRSKLLPLVLPTDEWFDRLQHWELYLQHPLSNGDAPGKIARVLNPMNHVSLRITFRVMGVLLFLGGLITLFVNSVLKLGHLGTELDRLCGDMANVCAAYNGMLPYDDCVPTSQTLPFTWGEICCNYIEECINELKPLTSDFHSFSNQSTFTFMCILFVIFSLSILGFFLNAICKGVFGNFQFPPTPKKWKPLQDALVALFKNFNEKGIPLTTEVQNICQNENMNREMLLKLLVEAQKILTQYKIEQPYLLNDFLLPEIGLLPAPVIKQASPGLFNQFKQKVSPISYDDDYYVVVDVDVNGEPEFEKPRRNGQSSSGSSRYGSIN
jgi:hypothetical protein